MLNKKRVKYIGVKSITWRRVCEGADEICPQWVVLVGFMAQLGVNVAWADEVRRAVKHLHVLAALRLRSGLGEFNVH